MNLSDYADQDLEKLKQEQGGGAGTGVPPAAPADPLETLRPFLAQRAKEIASAQQDTNERQKWADLANSFERARAWGNDTKVDQGTIDQHNAEAQRPLAQALQRQGAEDAAVKGVGDAQQVAARTQTQAWEAAKRDSNSAASRAIQKLYAPILGDRAQFLTAADAEEAGKAGGLDIQKLNAITQQRQLANEAAARAETARHNQADEGLREKQIGVEQSRVTTENALKFNKPIEPQESVKINNQIQAVKAIDNLEDLHGKVGGSAYIPGLNVGESGRYADAVKGSLPAIVAGALPQGKESPGALEEFAKMVPSPVITKDRAHAAFQQLRQRVLDNAQAQIDSYRASGMYNKAQIDSLQAQVDQAKKRMQGAPADEPPAPTGRVNVLDPAGKPFNLPAGQVDAYLRANPGARRAGS